jgi:hypothetical protein
MQFVQQAVGQITYAYQTVAAGKARTKIANSDTVNGIRRGNLAVLHPHRL